jgi:hypothetical protein
VPKEVLIDTDLLDKRLVKSLIKLVGQLILSRDFLIADIGAESKAFAISREVNQNSLLKVFAACRAELTMVRGSIVLWPGSPAKLNSDRTLLSLRALVNLLLRVPVKTFLTDSIKEIGLVSLSLWLQMVFFGIRVIEASFHDLGMEHDDNIELNIAINDSLVLFPKSLIKSYVISDSPGALFFGRPLIVSSRSCSVNGEIV